MEREELLNKIDQALERMRKRGHDKHPAFLNLMAKREAIANGAEYRIVNLAPELIGGFGAAICTLNVFRGGKYAGNNAIQRGIERGRQFWEEIKEM